MKYVQILKTKIGPAGAFIKDEVREVSDSVASALIAGGVAKPASAPWNAKQARTPKNKQAKPPKTK